MFCIHKNLRYKCKDGECCGGCYCEENYDKYRDCEQCWNTRLAGKPVTWFHQQKLTQKHLNEGYSVYSRSKDGNGKDITEKKIIGKAVFSTHATTVANANKINSDGALKGNDHSDKRNKRIFVNTTEFDPSQQRTRSRTEENTTFLKGIRNHMKNKHDVNEDDDVVMIVLENNQHKDFKKALNEGKIFDWRRTNNHRRVLYIDKDEVKLGNAKMYRLSSELVISDFIPESSSSGSGSSICSCDFSSCSSSCRIGCSCSSCSCGSSSSSSSSSSS